ncbi:MAG: hypothetical protein A3B99_03280 [Candidatus Yanofskybacteria bacterium RIFCSPHIGHO2_02_FULL_44_12b]|nr:MAG: hypothetical protein A3B99_03280 [Candidatus Yanofskybacteria bacterium RIFCSPHIGHO2_02_FULL_44_12b]
MSFKIPKNDSKYWWTQHAIRKMVFYGLSPDRVKRTIRNPKRERGSGGEYNCRNVRRDESQETFRSLGHVRRAEGASQKPKVKS